MNYVNSAVRKKDAISLVSGKPVYTGDMIRRTHWLSRFCAAHMLMP